MPSGWINGLAADGQGALWVLRAAGLTRYDGAEYRTFTTADGLPSNAVLAGAADGEGRLWLGTDAGAVRFDGHEWLHLTEADGLLDARVLAVHTWTATGFCGSGRGGAQPL